MQNFDGNCGILEIKKKKNRRIEVLNIKKIKLLKLQSKTYSNYIPENINNKGVIQTIKLILLVPTTPPLSPIQSTKEPYNTNFRIKIPRSKRQNNQREYESSNSWKENFSYIGQTLKMRIINQ